VGLGIIDFKNHGNNRFLAVRELKITGRRAPDYSIRADLICFVNGLPLVFIKLKAVYKNIFQSQFRLCERNIAESDRRCVRHF